MPESITTRRWLRCKIPGSAFVQPISMAPWLMSNCARVDCTTRVDTGKMLFPSGYVRLLVDLGLPMARLLQSARSRKVMPDYVARLPAAFGEDWYAAERRLPESMTKREAEILKLLAAG